MKARVAASPAEEDKRLHAASVMDFELLTVLDLLWSTGVQSGKGIFFLVEGANPVSRPSYRIDEAHRDT